MGYNAQHATGSKAFTENIRRVVGRRAGGSQFKYFNQYGNAAQNDVDVLILDEAHRLRETSASRFTPKAKRTDLPQVDELIKAAKTTVFFIDDYQTVRPNEVGSTQRILEAADRNGADVSAFELDTQFRMSGSKAFLTWVDHTLGLTEAATPTWDADNETFDFRIVDSVEQLDALIRTKADEGHSARLTAGFCWPWSNPEADGTLVNDVKVGAWQMPWNAKPDAGRLAPGIPPSNFWASDPNGLDQVGCVYTAQGFEFDYVGVIWGRDLRWDPATTDLDRRPEPLPRLHRQTLRRPLHRPRQTHLPRPPHPRPQGLLRLSRGPRHNGSVQWMVSEMTWTALSVARAAVQSYTRPLRFAVVVAAPLSPQGFRAAVSRLCGLWGGTHGVIVTGTAGEPIAPQWRQLCLSLRPGRNRCRKGVQQRFRSAARGAGDSGPGSFSGVGRSQ